MSLLVQFKAGIVTLLIIKLIHSTTIAQQSDFDGVDTISKTDDYNPMFVMFRRPFRNEFSNQLQGQFPSPFQSQYSGHVNSQPRIFNKIFKPLISPNRNLPLQQTFQTFSPVNFVKENEDSNNQKNVDNDKILRSTNDESFDDDTIIGTSKQIPRSRLDPMSNHVIFEHSNQNVETDEIINPTDIPPQDIYMTEESNENKQTSSNIEDETMETSDTHNLFYNYINNLLPYRHEAPFNYFPASNYYGNHELPPLNFNFRPTEIHRGHPNMMLHGWKFHPFHHQQIPLMNNLFPIRTFPLPPRNYPWPSMYKANGYLPLNGLADRSGIEEHENRRHEFIPEEENLNPFDGHRHDFHALNEHENFHNFDNFPHNMYFPDYKTYPSVITIEASNPKEPKETSNEKESPDKKEENQEDEVKNENDVQDKVNVEILDNSLNNEEDQPTTLKISDMPTMNQVTENDMQTTTEYSLETSTRKLNEIDDTTTQSEYDTTLQSTERTETTTYLSDDTTVIPTTEALENE
ncbi:CLUMA_CG008285, isoform A [Clunio marinus]|uniref:CLUMA_CG008285, isoform A n=1 Tax=Clunio marinus TaxID=568069 RepID=A0A1J1I384_9DIPT|nr:CLUMA_CG008285, isoform A [Clunio marinus]